MQSFADILTDYFKKNKICYQQTARSIQLSRHTLKRYVDGERKPKTEDLVLKIADAISMSEEEKQTLLLAYRREHKGERYYMAHRILNQIYERKALPAKEEIHNLYDTPEIEADAGVWGAQYDQSLLPICEIAEFQRILSVMLRNTGALKVKCHRREYLQDLYDMLLKHTDCKLELMIELEDLHNKDAWGDLKLFEVIYPMLKSDIECQIYTSYVRENVEKNVEKYYVLSDTGVLVLENFESGRVKGFYTEIKEIYRYFRENFVYGRKRVILMHIMSGNSRTNRTSPREMCRRLLTKKQVYNL